MDHGADHETKAEFGLEEAAERLLAAVAEGLPESVARAGELVAAILSAPLVKRAVALDELLRRLSPVTLVRAVELADEVLFLFEDAGVGLGVLAARASRDRHGAGSVSTRLQADVLEV